MGVSESQIQQFQNEYIIDKEVTQPYFGQVTKVIHIKTDESYFLKQFIFQDKEQYEYKKRLIEQYRKLDMENLVEFQNAYFIEESQFCATNYKIYLVFEQIQNTLQLEVDERSAQYEKKYFQEFELWVILSGIVNGLAHLDKENIKHGQIKPKSILVNRKGVIKLTSPEIFDKQTNFENFSYTGRVEDNYLSPEQQQYQNVNLHKSDIFCVGICILFASLLENQNYLYLKQYQKGNQINAILIEDKLVSLQRIYSQQFISVLRYLIQFDPEQRMPADKINELLNQEEYLRWQEEICTEVNEDDVYTQYASYQQQQQQQQQHQQQNVQQQQNPVMYYTQSYYQPSQEQQQLQSNNQYSQYYAPQQQQQQQSQVHNYQHPQVSQNYENKVLQQNNNVQVYDGQPKITYKRISNPQDPTLYKKITQEEYLKNYKVGGEKSLVQTKEQQRIQNQENVHIVQ